MFFKNGHQKFKRNDRVRFDNRNVCFIHGIMSATMSDAMFH